MVSMIRRCATAAGRPGIRTSGGVLCEARHTSPQSLVRIADDIADHPNLSETTTWATPDLEASLLGRDDHNAAGIVLRAALAERNLSPQHAQDLLKAFRQDVTKHRYADWDELIDYCRYSAMPVGRFVLDVHGESRSTWPASDNVCAVLQIINHLQDCVKDYRALTGSISRSMRSRRQAGGASRPYALAPRRKLLRACLAIGLADRTGAMLEEGSNLLAQINDRRLAPEIAAIVTPWRGISVRLLRPVATRWSENVRVWANSGVATWGARRREGFFGAPDPADRRGHQINNRRTTPHALSTEVQAARRHRASGSSFYTAMRILPRAQREAMFEIYSFCRLVDDVADSTAPHAERSLLDYEMALMDRVPMPAVRRRSCVRWRRRCATSGSARRIFWP